MVMASFQPSSTMATMAHRGGSRLLAALLASWVFTACNTVHACSAPALTDNNNNNNDDNNCTAFQLMMS
jgi:hypothetical protein